jgi:hypothetical protein
MSFAESLWDRFDLVHSANQERRKGLSQLIFLLKERSTKDEAYSKELEKLAQHPYMVTNHGTLAHAVVSMKNDFGNHSMQTQLLADNITNDILEPLNDLLKT